MKDLDFFYLKHDVPINACLLALKAIILDHDEELTNVWKYRMPFFCYRGKMLCYLWVHAKYQKPYIGFVDGNLIHHEALISEKRTRMKILLVDDEEDLPIDQIKGLLMQAILLRNK